METVQELAVEKQEIVRLKKELARLLSVNEKLKDELLYLRRAIFGRTSERYVKEDPNQLTLDFEGMDQLPEEEQAALEEAKETITYERKKKTAQKEQPVRQALPAHLERKEEIIEPALIEEVNHKKPRVSRKSMSIPSGQSRYEALVLNGFAIRPFSNWVLEIICVTGAGLCLRLS